MRLAMTGGRANAGEGINKFGLLICGRRRLQSGERHHNRAVYLRWDWYVVLEIE